MLTEKTYVRFPADIESMPDSRVFACGQITKIDEFKKTATVKIHDPFQYSLFFEDMPKGTVELPISMLDHCSLFRGSEVIVNGELCSILSGPIICRIFLSNVEKLVFSFAMILGLVVTPAMG